MKWNWEQADWPRFAYRTQALDGIEARFLRQSGEFLGAYRHIGPDDQEMLKIELIRDEALKTSEIEGEILNRDSVQSSLLHQFGLGKERPGVPPAERGVAEMMVDLYRTFARPLGHRTLFRWHRMLLGADDSLAVVGGYRTRTDPMQVVSGPLHRRKIHFEAPPADRVHDEMTAFIAWFNETAPKGKRPLPPVTRAGLAHLYFVSIHPFEDGNGRIARAIAEKVLAQGLGQPSLIALAHTIERKRKGYYAALELNNKDMEVTGWMTSFGETVLQAQVNTILRVDFYVAKARFYRRLQGALNERQEKVIARMFREGTDGFKGGLSAENYITISKASRATATRDLQDLVAKGAFSRTGELRHTRYQLDLTNKS